MAKNDLKLNLEDSNLAAPQPEKQDKKQNRPKKTNAKKGGNKSGKPNLFQRIAKVFREMYSELKKVDWPPFKRTKNNPGVWANFGTVIVVVLFFMVVITAFDFGLTALLRLLVNY